MAVPILDLAGGTASYNVNSSGTTSLVLNNGGVSLGNLATSHGNGFCYAFTVSNGSHVTGVTDSLGTFVGAFAFAAATIVPVGAGSTELWRARIPSAGLTGNKITVAFGGGNTYAVGMAWCVSDPSGGVLLVDADASTPNGSTTEGFITTTSPNCFISAGYRGSVSNPAAGAGMSVIFDSSIATLSQFSLAEYVTKVSPGSQGMTFNVGDYGNVACFIAESVSLTGTVVAASNSLGIMGLSAAEW